MSIKKRKDTSSCSQHDKISRFSQLENRKHETFQAVYMISIGCSFSPDASCTSDSKHDLNHSRSFSNTTALQLFLASRPDLERDKT